MPKQNVDPSNMRPKHAKFLYSIIYQKHQMTIVIGLPLHVPVFTSSAQLPPATVSTQIHNTTTKKSMATPRSIQRCPQRGDTPSSKNVITRLRRICYGKGFRHQVVRSQSDCKKQSAIMYTSLSNSETANLLVYEYPILWTQYVGAIIIS